MENDPAVIAIPEDLNEDLFYIEAGQRLGVPVTDVRSMPLHFLGSLRVLMKAENLQRAAQAKRYANARTKQAPARRR